MDVEKIQNDIDTLLVFMNDDLENQGMTIKQAYFDFTEGAGDFVSFTKKNDWNKDDLYKIIKICITRSLIKNDYGNTFCEIKITEEGQSRAISVKHGKKRAYELGASMQIATLNVNGPAQAGNGNTQNFNMVFHELEQKIDASGASDEEKKEAKSRLAKLLEHPLVSAIAGGIAGGISGMAG